MTVRKYSSRSQQTTLASAITSSDSTMTVISGAQLMGGKTPASGETYTVVIDPDTALEEIVDVSNYSSGNTLNITRGIDGSTAVAHSAGAVVRHMIIGRDLQESNDHIENTTIAHGITLANLVKTTDTGVISTAMLASNAVTTAKITDANVTTAKIADSGVTTAKIADSNVTTAKIADSAVTSAKIADGTIVNADINSSAAIDKTKISGTAITAGDTGTVTSTMIADGTIVNADINASAAIAATKIAGTAVTQSDTGTVTSTMIADGTITNADISASAAISYSKLNLAGTITSADIVNGTIVAADIADGTITAAKLVADPYARANHTGSQTSSTISDFDTQVRTSRLDQMTAPTGSVSMNSQKITSLATPTLDTDASTKAYVDTSIANLIDGAPSTLDTLNEIAAALNDTANFSDTVVLKAGSTMTGPLTLSGAPSSNLHAATKAYVDSFASNVSADAAAAAASAAAAAASYDSFDDRYLGAKASAPSVDNDGNALVAGALYWNTTTGAMQVWDAGTSAWEGITSAVSSIRWSKTATGGETTLNGADNNTVTLSYTPGYEQVYLNGVLLARGDDYTASNGSSITGLAALTAGDIVEVLSWTPYSVANAVTSTIVDAKGDLLVGTASDTIGRLAVGTNGYYLKADSTTGTGLAWSAVDALPSQTSNSGKYLTTDGSTASWSTITTDPNPQIFMMMGA